MISQQLTYNMYIRAMYVCDKYIRKIHYGIVFKHMSVTHTFMTSSALSEINMSSLLLF